MRLAAPALTLLIGLFANDPALAVTFSVTNVSTTGPSLAALRTGDTVTIDIRVSADAQQVSGLGASAFGYDESVVDFQSGAAVASIFHAVAVPPNTASQGLANVVPNRLALAESSIGTNGNRVQIFNGISLTARTNQPLDPGLDGIVGGGDAQFRLTFLATGVGPATITIGVGYVGDATVGPGGSLLPNTNAVVGMTVLPEPVPVAPTWMMITLAALLGGVAAAWSPCSRAGPQVQ